MSMYKRELKSAKRLREAKSWIRNNIIDTFDKQQLESYVEACDYARHYRKNPTYEGCAEKMDKQYHINADACYDMIHKYIPKNRFT